VTYGSFTAFGPSPESAPGTSQYRSVRDSSTGWSTANINPRFEEGSLNDPFAGFSTDLSHAAAYVIEPELTADAAVDVPNLYWRDNTTGSLEAITTEEHHPQIASGAEYCLSYGGTSADSRHVFFAAKGILAGAQPEPAAPLDGFNLYEWSAEKPPSERLSLVSVLPDGTPATAALGTGFGGSGVSKGCAVSKALLRHAISSDGSRVLWTYSGTYQGAPNPLLARLPQSEETVRLDKPNTGVSGSGGEGRYQDASRDGSKVFFTDTIKLTAGATATAGAPDLYRYDFAAPEGERLTDLTAPEPVEAGNVPAGVKGVIGASADGTRAYFVATGALTEEENEAHEKAVSGQSNLFAWQEGEGIRFVAGLAGLADASDWALNPTARVSPDCMHLVFLSTRSLTGYDNAEAIKEACGNPTVEEELCPQVFVYDLASGDLACASCNPTNERPAGPSSLPTAKAPYEQPRYLSDDGTRLFFESSDALSPHDTNGKRDVYEFERPGSGSCTAGAPTYNPAASGCLFLISGGASPDSSYLVDASGDARDVFISTREQLYPADKDDRFDVYDARVGGGFPYNPPIPCEGSCRGEGTGPGPIYLPGTSAFDAPPEPAAKPCKKGFVRKGSKCVKKSHHKAKHHKKKSKSKKGHAKKRVHTDRRVAR
jgi:hypothetical protein